ncbi:hypothetical protein [Photobacterium leiognathi]|uniref:hypothetical protein n=1 Tax=Photobacterium leiognathi TaxID=553611 RepID=UPI000769E0D3|nr:hypothetical protein [Photobacterium leiognathi]
MKKILCVCTGLMLMMPFSLQAQGGGANSPTGPFVECSLPNGNIEYMPAMFCEVKHGKYQH